MGEKSDNPPFFKKNWGFLSFRGRGSYEKGKEIEMKKLFVALCTVVACSFIFPLVVWNQTMTYQESSEGGWKTPKERVYFGESLRNPMMTKIGDKVFSGEQVYQEGVDVKTDKNGTSERIAIAGVTGIPFPAEPLRVNTNATLQKTVVKIEATEAGFLIPAKDSAVPIFMNLSDGGLEVDSTSFTRAINVTWEFMKPGIRFTSGGYLYTVQRKGASISFTKNGLKIDGVGINKNSNQIAGVQRTVSPEKLSQEQSQQKEASNDAGIISITTNPPGAKIFINGEYKGQTPAEISLTTGSYQLFLQRQLYAPYKDSVIIEKGQTKTLNIRLSPERGTQ